MQRHFTLSCLKVGVQAIVIALLLSVLLVKAPTTHASSTASGSSSPGQGLQAGQLLTGGKDHQLKNSKPKSMQPYIIPGSTGSLSYSPAQYVSEPPYTGTDSAGHGYTDEYFWNECGPGASTATLGYWGAVNLNKGTATYSDPHMSTTWNNTNYYSYVQYIATKTYPPAYTSAGEMTYQSYPNAYAAFADVRDALNWEASGHNSSTYFNYFYAVVGVGSLSESTFENDVQTDISTSHAPLIVSLNDNYLPDWKSPHGTSHFITILGYNFNNWTMTYSETCGQTSCNTQGTGIYTVAISQLWNGMVNDNGNGGIIW